MTLPQTTYQPDPAQTEIALWGKSGRDPNLPNQTIEFSLSAEKLMAALQSIKPVHFASPCLYFDVTATQIIMHRTTTDGGFGFRTALPLPAMQHDLVTHGRFVMENADYLQACCMLDGTINLRACPANRTLYVRHPEFCTQFDVVFEATMPSEYAPPSALVPIETDTFLAALRATNHLIPRSQQIEQCNSMLIKGERMLSTTERIVSAFESKALPNPPDFLLPLGQLKNLIALMSRQRGKSTMTEYAGCVYFCNGLSAVEGFCRNKMLTWFAPIEDVFDREEIGRLKIDATILARDMPILELFFQDGVTLSTIRSDSGDKVTGLKVSCQCLGQLTNLKYPASTKHWNDHAAETLAQYKYDIDDIARAASVRDVDTLDLVLFKNFILIEGQADNSTWRAVVRGTAVKKPI